MYFFPYKNYEDFKYESVKYLLKKYPLFLVNPHFGHCSRLLDDLKQKTFSTIISKIV